MLARVVNDYACLLVERGALESIASRLAPTGDWGRFRGHPGPQAHAREGGQRLRVLTG